MKKKTKQFIIVDPINQTFWKSNRHYGWTLNNKRVFETFFTEVLSEATLMDEKKAKETLKAFSEIDFVQYGSAKVDGLSLVIAPVDITFEIKL